MEENLEHLETKYKECIRKILENENISLVEREFYAESPNWYNNNDFKNVINTLVWLTYNDVMKIFLIMN